MSLNMARRPLVLLPVNRVFTRLWLMSKPVRKLRIMPSVFGSRANSCASSSSSKVGRLSAAI